MIYSAEFLEESGSVIYDDFMKMQPMLH